ncbi:MAG: cobalamin B12-binding domain-containing protein [Nitrospirae bacterium]|nr:cobalamin B12-binding domain-containing protein [Nitrospirota bacterium]
MTINNILLIHPSKKVTGKKDTFYSKEYLTPSLGLGIIAACLKQKGINVSVIDLRLPHRSVADVLSNVKIRKPLMIGITAFTNEITSAGEVAQIIKDELKSAFVVLGGPHGTASPEETLKEFPAIDAVVIGEGEETIAELMEALQDKKELDNIKGLAFRRDGRILINEKRNTAVDINSLPFPEWDIFEIPHYTGPFMISASRGCPFPCYFCTPNYLGRVRVRDPLKVVDEMEWDVKHFGAARFQFADATLSLLEEKTSLLCQEIIERGLNRRISWECETRADKMSPELLRKVREAGCKCIALGVETGSERILKDVIKKGETKEDIKKAVGLIKKAGMKVRCFFLIGHYTETPETIKETIGFALDLNPDGLSFGLLVPNPGTKLRALAEEGPDELQLHGIRGLAAQEIEVLAVKGVFYLL